MQPGSALRAELVKAIELAAQELTEAITTAREYGMTNEQIDDVLGVDRYEPIFSHTPAPKRGRP